MILSLALVFLFLVLFSGFLFTATAEWRGKIRRAREWNFSFLCRKRPRGIEFAFGSECDATSARKAKMLDFETRDELAENAENRRRVGFHINAKPKNSQLES